MSVSEKWQLGDYTFTINPNKYGEGYNFIGDNVVTLYGTVISMPTVVQEQYNFSSTLYQGMPRLLNQVSMSNGVSVKLLSGNYYVANNSTKKIDKYSSNFILLSSTSTGITSANLLALDVVPSGTMYVLDDLVGGQTLHTVSSSGSATTKVLSNISGEAQGIK